MNPELKKLYEQDQQDRTNIDWDNEELVKEVIKRDRYRRKRVNYFIKEKKLRTGKDYYHASMIFQHGVSINHYFKAHSLAKKAVELGCEEAKWLYAATLDRLLVKKGEKQKYGTQYFKSSPKHKWKIRPYDKKTTDEERAKYNVPSIKELLDKEKILNKK